MKTLLNLHFARVASLALLVGAGCDPVPKQTISEGPSTKEAYPIVQAIEISTDSQQAAAQTPLKLEDLPTLSEQPEALGSILYCEAPNSKLVEIAGTWDGWAEPLSLTQGTNNWEIDVAPLSFPPGRHEYKFILDDEYEAGDNRLVYINEEGVMETPSGIINRAVLTSSHSIKLTLKKAIDLEQDFEINLEPDHGKLSITLVGTEEGQGASGYTLEDDELIFEFDPATYMHQPEDIERVQIAGNFTGWNPDHPDFAMKAQSNGMWTLTTSLSELKKKTTGPSMLFKFVINDAVWMEPPGLAPNQKELNNHNNLEVDPSGAAGQYIEIDTRKSISLTNPPRVVITGMHEKTLYAHVEPGTLLDYLISDAKMGVTLDYVNTNTLYRIFAPRATAVHLCFFDTPHYQTLVKKKATRLTPRERLPMEKMEDGSWKLTRDSWDVGEYYAFQIDGPSGDAEGFAPKAFSADPYARAMAHAENCSIVIDPNADSPYFKGWSDSDFDPAPWHKTLIYETHIRDLTSQGCGNEKDKGSYKGFTGTLGLDCGLGYLKELGVTAIELMPIQEFTNGTTNRHDWGYGPSFFWAPEASYAQEPLKGSQYYEFKQLVDDLHAAGFSVILDVVYNHIGGVNPFNGIDRKYYFRMNPDLTLQNFSGCGNDVRTEAPMMRKFIVENVLYWMEEFHIDGFRFDLAELIDFDTLLEIEETARSLNPEVLLISEPWSFRGTHKYKLRGTGWAAWNDEIRNGIKDFVKGHNSVDKLKVHLEGGMKSWTGHPMQNLAYIESHDDHSLSDELSTRDDKDGRIVGKTELTRHCQAATLLLTSLGIPMLTEGQEWMRSKHGVRNTYNKGDALNGLRWEELNDPDTAIVRNYYRELIALRYDEEKGFPLRMRAAPEEGYYRFLPQSGEQFIGYFINAEEQVDGPAYLIMMNAGKENIKARFNLPEGDWNVIADGPKIDHRGFPKRNPLIGGRQGAMTIKPGGIKIFRRDPIPEAEPEPQPQEPTL